VRRLGRYPRLSRLVVVDHAGAQAALACAGLFRAAQVAVRGCWIAGSPSRSNRVMTRAFAATRAACELVGWRYEVVGSPDPIMMMNARWLSGYRHPRHDVPAVAAALEAVFVTRRR